MKMTEDTRRSNGIPGETVAPVPEEVVLQEAGGWVSFRGYLIKKVSTRTGTQPRWTELSLYKVTDENGGYALANTGRSVLYHQPGPPCNLGVTKLIRELSDEEYEELESHNMLLERYPGDPKALPACNPVDLDQLDAGTPVAVELNLHEVTKCATAASVQDELTQPRRNRDGTVTRFLSEPAQRLLNEAAEVDRDIAEALAKVRPL
jgi:hypothetical protein